MRHGNVSKIRPRKIGFIQPACYSSIVNEANAKSFYVACFLTKFVNHTCIFLETGLIDQATSARSIIMHIHSIAIVQKCT